MLKRNVYKKFSLEEYQKGNCLVKTRDGRPVRILDTELVDFCGRKKIAVAVMTCGKGLGDQPHERLYSVNLNGMLINYGRGTCRRPCNN